MEMIFSIRSDWRPKAVGRSYPQVIGTDTPELIHENIKRKGQ